MGDQNEKSEMGRDRRMKWVGACSKYGGEQRCVQVLLGKPDGERPLGRLSCRWEDNIKMDLQEVGCGGMDRIELAQDRDRRRALGECGNEPSGYIKCGEFLDWLETG